MDRLTEMQVFVAVVETGTFTAASEKLGISKSAVSKHITSLEQRLGARLLDRTTRRVNPTEIGHSYYERVLVVLAQASDADEMVGALQSTPRGRLKISAPVSFGIRHLSGAMSAFLKAHPDVTVELVLEDRFVDLISEGYDLALRIGTLADSSLLARKIGTTQLVLMASQQYLDEHGTPETTADLGNHNLLQYSTHGIGNSWRLATPDGEDRHVRGSGSLTANNGDILLAAAKQGIGIIHLPTFFLCGGADEKDLRFVLPDHPQPHLTVSIIFPPGRYTQPKTRAFIDFMASYFADKGPMDW